MIGLLLLLLPVSAQAAPIKVVASFSILADMVGEITGEHAAVVALVGRNGDAHAFDPSPADAGKLADAGLVIANGLGLDGWIERLAGSAGYTGKIVVASAGIVPQVRPGSSAPDPHAWQDLKNGIAYVRSIETALEAADPANAGAYQQAANRYAAKLAALDTEVRAKIAGIAEAKRRVITSHDAFGYFGEAYGVTFLAAAGISTDTEPSAGGIARLVDQIRAEGIKAVFLENMPDPRLIGTIAAETGTTPGGTLYSDALSAPDGPAATYAAMFAYNVITLTQGMARN